MDFFILGHNNPLNKSFKYIRLNLTLLIRLILYLEQHLRQNQHVELFSYVIDLKMTLTLKVKLLNFIFLQMSFILRYNNTDDKTDMLNYSAMTFTLKWTFQQGQVTDFCLNCNNLFIFGWIRFILGQNTENKSKMLINSRLTLAFKWPWLSWNWLYICY